MLYSRSFLSLLRQSTKILSGIFVLGALTHPLKAWSCGSAQMHAPTQQPHQTTQQNTVASQPIRPVYNTQPNSQFVRQPVQAPLIYYPATTPYYSATTPYYPGTAPAIVPSHNPQTIAPPHYSQPFALPANIEKEPMLLLDTTGSMQERNSPNDPQERLEIVRKAIKSIVKTLKEHDSQAINESGDEGGLRTITFAGNHAKDIGDLNLENLTDKWDQIDWSGSTWIMPGWDKLIETYEDEFGTGPNRPKLMALVITDGEALDSHVFVDALDQSPDAYVTIALLGYGKAHDDALRSFKKLYEHHPERVRLLSFESETDPRVISSALIQMIQ